MKILSWFVVILGIFGLIAVRVFEKRLFYDPFLSYFHEVNKELHFPNFEWGKLIAGHLFRFFLNLFFSCLIIQFWFNNKQWTIQGAILIVIIFIITFPIYLYCISVRFDVGHLFSFYMRRFVIQPIILLLIIPMFYYRRRIMQQRID
jgi:exosortase F-associated protein